MNFKDMLEKMSLLSEATKETPKGKVHTADAGGYGRKFDTDEEGDEKKADKKEPAAKRGRGRPKKGADDSGEVKKYDFSAFGVKHGKDIKLPKHDKSKTTKHSLKEYFDSLDNALNEAEQITIAPAQSNTQVIKQGNKVLGSVTNPQLAAQIKQSIGKGEMSLAGSELHELSPSTIQSAAAKRDAQQPGQMSQATQRKDPMVHATNRINMNNRVEEEMTEEGGDKWIQKAVKHPGAFSAKAKAAGKSVAAYAKEKAHAPGTLGKQARLAQTLSKISKTNEADQPPHDSLASPMTLEGKGEKPDFLDLDKDGNKKESMKKAAQDKKKVKEGMDHRLKAARHAGKAHALGKEAYNCKYDDMEEARSYHDGYKEGLDECYGQMPIQGYVGETTPPATVPGMASQAMKQPAMEDEMEEGNAFTAALAKTPKGGKFSVGGKTFTDRSDYNSKVDESPFAFESWDNQLQSLLESKEDVSEGMSVSISKGQQGSPDSVSVTAQDGEADALLGLIKQAGLGLFGGDEHNGYGAPQGDALQHGGVNVVGDHDGMMALIKKVTGGEAGNGDYADEEGHEHTDEEACNECGMAYESCGCDHGDKEVVDEVESEDQMTYQVAEDNPPDSGEEEFVAMDSEIATDNAAASPHGGATNEGEGGPEASEEPVQPIVSEESDEEEDDHAEKAGEKVAKDIEDDEGHKGDDDDKAEEAGKKVTKDIEYDDKKDKKEKKLDEWANDAGKKGTDTAFETDIDFMMNVISGGLNKKKSTGQTTIPVIASQLNRQVAHNTTDINESADPVSEWKKLAGLK